MNAPSTVLVVGGGPAAQRLVERLRHHGRARTRILPGDDCGTPGRQSAAADRPATRVTRIDVEHRRVLASVDGQERAYPYDTLVLVPQARPLLPDLPGLVDSAGHLTDGVIALGPADAPPRTVTGTAVVLGDAPSAVETAGALAAHRVDTTLVCSSPQPLSPQLGRTCGRMLAEELRRAGVTVMPASTAVVRVPGSLGLADGSTLRADTLVLCGSTVPDTQLARTAGVRVNDGIVVDDHLRTGDPNVYAIGDCAEHDGRVLSGPNAALEQAETLAAILTGHASSYHPGPSVLRLRTHVADVAAIGSPADLRRPGTRLIGLTDPASRRYARLALRDDHVVAAVLLGLPEAIATIGLLHRRSRPLPADRLGLLLNLSTPPASGANSMDDTDDTPVCLCNNVSQRTLRHAWRAGARTVPALAATTRATTGCGGCGPSVTELCGVWASERHDGEWEKAS